MLPGMLSGMRVSHALSILDVICPEQLLCTKKGVRCAACLKYSSLSGAGWETVGNIQLLRA